VNIRSSSFASSSMARKRSSVRDPCSSALSMVRRVGRVRPPSGAISARLSHLSLRPEIVKYSARTGKNVPSLRTQ